MFIVKYTDPAGRIVYAPTDDPITFLAARVADGQMTAKAAQESEAFRAFPAELDAGALRKAITDQTLARQIKDYGPTLLLRLLSKKTITPEQAQAALDSAVARWPLDETLATYTYPLDEAINIATGKA